MIEHKANGIHIIADFKGMKNPFLIADDFTAAAKQTGATIEAEAHKSFEIGGITSVILLSESHLSAHTWPEQNYMAVDVFTCGDNCDPLKAIEFLSDKTGTIEIHIRIIGRGNERIPWELEDRIRSKKDFDRIRTVYYKLR